jgi:hypothetical protein
MYLLIVKGWKADTTGLLVYILVAILILILTTSVDSIFFICIAGIIDSCKNTIMVGMSILMITYMEESGSLARIVVRGGLASVITPTKVQNAAAAIDEIGIEGRVISNAIGIFILMLLVLAVLTIFWAKSYPIIDFFGIINISIIFIFYVISSFIMGFLYMRRNGS